MKKLFLQILAEGNKKVFNTWLVLFFILGLALSSWLIERLSSELFAAEKKIEEFKLYKEEVDGFEHFVDFYPTCQFLNVTLDSTDLPYLVNLSDFVEWQKGISKDSLKTKVTLHGFTVNFNGLQTVRDTVYTYPAVLDAEKLIKDDSELLNTVASARINSLVSFLPFESQIERISNGEILSTDSSLIRKMAYQITADLLMLRVEASEQSKDGVKL